ncbi:lytic transglycosylase domain-containing protein [Solwaraspora sp. WMMD406]|uniref:aggregation-promoting factor C-terminal-like domain-containing protein n=1 Tax=Solwaraspora sp. WMMD406 TaxID=3016095 RepID=UPI002415BAC0|nr:lytic transglycosylase domain-containing protein [Solwaraspora sp. WMMD406]MDG4767843.1 lytic transglycosylase domain-containing protein [Solwaraspora sp. WMMD406]
MSRLWSRFGIRALAVGLLVLGVAGGLYLDSDRETQQRITDARLAAEAEQVELEVLRQRRAEHQRLTVQRRTAEREAAEKAVAIAKAEAAKAKRAEKVTEQKQQQQTSQSSSSGATVPFNGPIPASCDEFSGNRAIGCALTLDRGWGLDQFACLNKLWNKESGWNHKARNPSSGAYGIPQSLPGNKMSSAGSDWENNPATQIKWGLGYISGRYGNPCGAWQHSQNVGWY